MLTSYLNAHPELAPTTLRSRRDVIKLFAAHHPLATASTADVEAFLTRPGWTAQTRASYRSHLAAYYGWLCRTGHRADNPMDNVRHFRVPRRVPRPLTADQTARLVAAATGSLRTAILLGAFAGLRCAEIAAVHTDDVSDGDVLYVLGKGGVAAMIPLHAMLAADLSRYFGFVFPRPDGGHVTSQAVQHRIRRHMARCGVKATPHQLRHTFGTNVYTNTRDLRLTQELMRHASPATTAVYTLVSDESRRAAIRSLRAV